MRENLIIYITKSNYIFELSKINIDALLRTWTTNELELLADLI